MPTPPPPPPPPPSFSVQFYGCYPRGVLPNLANCAPVPSTIDAQDATMYRHYAIDDDKDIVYFCDRNPYVEGMFCYSMDQKNAAGTWRGERAMDQIGDSTASTVKFFGRPCWLPRYRILFFGKNSSYNEAASEGTTDSRPSVSKYY